MENALNVGTTSYFLLLAACMIASHTSFAQENNPAAAQSNNPESMAVLRSFDDPGTGERWYLLRNSRHPSGPGKLIHRKLHESPDQRFHSPCAPINPKNNSAPLVIHAGERIVVEHHGSNLEAGLEATALTGASARGPLDVRLKFGGRLMHAVALGPGRAEMLIGGSHP